MAQSMLRCAKHGIAIDISVYESSQAVGTRGAWTLCDGMGRQNEVIRLMETNAPGNGKLP